MYLEIKIQAGKSKFKKNENSCFFDFKTCLLAFLPFYIQLYVDILLCAQKQADSAISLGVSVIYICVYIYYIHVLL